MAGSSFCIETLRGGGTNTDDKRTQVCREDLGTFIVGVCATPYSTLESRETIAHASQTILYH